MMTNGCEHGGGRYIQEVDCGAYVAIMIFCVLCGSLIAQVNKYKDEEQKES